MRPAKAPLIVNPGKYGPKGLTKYPRTSASAPVMAPYTGPKRIPLIKIGTCPKLIRRTDNPPINMSPAKKRASIMLVATNRPANEILLTLLIKKSTSFLFEWQRRHNKERVMLENQSLYVAADAALHRGRVLPSFRGNIPSPNT